MTSHHLIDRGCLLVVVCHHVWTISHNNTKGNSNKNILPKFLNPLVHHCINPGSVPTRNGVGDHFGYSLSSFLFISTIFLLDNCSKSIACSTKRAPVVYTATVSATNCCKTLQSRLQKIQIILFKLLATPPQLGIYKVSSPLPLCRGET